MNYYEQLPSFHSFNELTLDSHFHPAPEDWSIIITDVKGSTKAIAEGRYKDVNTVGAASIVVARKAMGNTDFPFVFGGDGATLLVPPEFLDLVLQKLLALKLMSEKNFGLSLRVGSIRVSELHEEAAKVEVAKYEMVKGRAVAMLRGAGVALAEAKIKGSPEKYEVSAQEGLQVNLDGLSCRWQPIPSRRGKVLTLLISSRRGYNVYAQVLEALGEIYPEGLEELNPSNLDSMSYKSIGQCLKEECRHFKTILNLRFLLRFLEIVIAVAAFKYKLPLVPGAQRYSGSMRTHSDYRKFDEMLRMILDSSPAQNEKVRKMLAKLHQSGDIFYGILESDNSLMTCYVDGLNEGEHIHFIDAENGGYAAAAVGLKQQMKEAASS